MELAFGKHTKNDGTSPCLTGKKSDLNCHIFNSFRNVYLRVPYDWGSTGIQQHPAVTSEKLFGYQIYTCTIQYVWDYHDPRWKLLPPRELKGKQRRVVNTAQMAELFRLYPYFHAEYVFCLESGTLPTERNEGLNQQSGTRRL